MCNVSPVDPPSIHQEKIASDGALDHPRLCSVLIWFDYPSCAEGGESSHETNGLSLPSPIRNPFLDAWSNPYHSWASNRWESSSQASDARLRAD